MLIKIFLLFVVICVYQAKTSDELSKLVNDVLYVANESDSQQLSTKANNNEVRSFFSTSNINLSKQPNTLDTIGHFGLGLYGAGIFQKYARLREELKQGQLKAMSLVMKLKREYVNRILNLGNLLRNTRISLETTLRNAVLTITEATPNPNKDTTVCYDTFENTKTVILAKINELNVNFQCIGLEILKLLDSYIDYYDKIAEECKVAYPNLLKQFDQLEICLRNKKDTLDAEASDVKFLVNDNSLYIQANITGIIQSVTRQVNYMVKTADTDFKMCIK